MRETTGPLCATGARRSSVCVCTVSTSVISASRPSTRTCAGRRNPLVCMNHSRPPRHVDPRTNGHRSSSLARGCVTPLDPVLQPSALRRVPGCAFTRCPRLRQSSRRITPGCPASFKPRPSPCEPAGGEVALPGPTRVTRQVISRSGEVLALVDHQRVGVGHSGDHYAPPVGVNHLLQPVVTWRTSSSFPPEFPYPHRS